MMNEHVDTSLSPQDTTALLEHVIYECVVTCLDKPALDETVMRVAMGLARCPDMTDARMLAISRALVRRALAQIAAELGRPDIDDDETNLQLRYDNAICRELFPSPD